MQDHAGGGTSAKGGLNPKPKQTRKLQGQCDRGGEQGKVCRQRPATAHAVEEKATPDKLYEARLRSACKCSASATQPIPAGVRDGKLRLCDMSDRPTYCTYSSCPPASQRKQGIQRYSGRSQGITRNGSESIVTVQVRIAGVLVS